MKEKTPLSPLAGLIDLWPDPGCLIDGQGIIRHANRPLSAALGSPAGLTGGAFVDALHAHDRGAFRHPSGDGTDAIHFEGRLKERGPDARPLRWRVSSLEGTELYAVVAHGDAPAKGLVAGSMPGDGPGIHRAFDEAAVVAITDRAGRITYANDMFCKLSKYTREELLGRDHRLINSGLHPKEFFRDMWATVARGEVWRGEIRNRAKDGSFYWVSSTITPVPGPDGRPERYVAVRFDITERKRAEEALAVALEAAAQASRAKDSFLANMSHEIRTPMNGVIGMLDLLRDTPLSAEQRAYIDTIQRSGETLVAIINDILDFSKIEAGMMSLESIPFDLRETIEDVVQVLAPQAHRKGLEIAALLHPEVPPCLRGDPIRVRQILLNLVGNAVKFTASGEVSVRARTLERTLDTARMSIEVTDTGIGMSPEEQARLFHAFSQGDDSTSRRFGGTGLGLAISRKLATLMGGAIEVASASGRGSRFTFTLELPTAVPAPDGQAEALARCRGRRILVAGDRGLTKEAVSLLLEGCGFIVSTAAPGRGSLEALARARGEGQEFSAVVLDAGEPTDGALEFLRRARADPAHPGLAVLAVSPNARATEALKAEGVAVLTRPVTRRGLCEALGNFLAQVSERAKVPRLVQEDQASERRRVLVVEDNEVNRQVLLAMLEKLGYAADAVPDGQAGVQAVAGGSYEMVLMDCHMPGMDGFEATGRIRKSGSKVPILAVTASALAGDRERVLAAGMDGYVAKPITVESLKTALQGLRTGPEAPDRAGIEPLEPALDMGMLNSLRELRDPGGVDMAKRVVGVYLDTLAARLASIHAALAGGDSRELADALHSLAGSSLTLGVRRVGLLCRALENEAREGRMSEVPESLVRIQDECRLAHEALTRALENPAPGSP